MNGYMLTESKSVKKKKKKKEKELKNCFDRSCSVIIKLHLEVLQVMQYFYPFTDKSLGSTSENNNF